MSTKTPESITVTAMDGTSVSITDVDRFVQHIRDFHGHGITIHTEAGHAFRVDDGFRQAIDKQLPDANLSD